MWKETINKFNKYPAQQKVIQKILELGLRVDEDKKVYCKDVEINTVSLAKSINVDRRVVKSTIDTITKDKELKEIFMNINPAGPLLTNISNILNIGVIEIEGSGQKPGILNEVCELLVKENISIRQAYASDPDMNDDPSITVITDKPVTGELLQDLLKIDGVSKVSIK